MYFSRPLISSMYITYWSCSPLACMLVESRDPATCSFCSPPPPSPSTWHSAGHTIMLSKYLLVDWLGCHPAQVPGMYAMLMGRKKRKWDDFRSSWKEVGWHPASPLSIKEPTMGTVAGGAQGNQGDIQASSSLAMWSRARFLVLLRVFSRRSRHMASCFSPAAGVPASSPSRSRSAEAAVQRSSQWRALRRARHSPMHSSALP